MTVNCILFVTNVYILFLALSQQTTALILPTKLLKRKGNLTSLLYKQQTMSLVKGLSNRTLHSSLANALCSCLVSGRMMFSVGRTCLVDSTPAIRLCRLSVFDCNHISFGLKVILNFNKTLKTTDFSQNKFQRFECNWWVLI